MSQNSQHMPVFTITVQKKILSLCCFSGLWTVSNTQKCTRWLRPGATKPQPGLSGQTQQFGCAAPEAALVAHWLSPGAKPGLALETAGNQQSQLHLSCAVPGLGYSAQVHSAGRSQWLLQRVTPPPQNHWCWMEACKASQIQTRLRLSLSSKNPELTAQ